jgi:hypothetical protein
MTPAEERVCDAFTNAIMKMMDIAVKVAVESEREACASLFPNDGWIADKIRARGAKRDEPTEGRNPGDPAGQP